jgi:hypothetical protein
VTNYDLSLTAYVPERGILDINMPMSAVCIRVYSSYMTTTFCLWINKGCFVVCSRKDQMALEAVNSKITDSSHSGKVNDPRKDFNL